MRPCQGRDRGFESPRARLAGPWHPRQSRGCLFLPLNWCPRPDRGGGAVRSRRTTVRVRWGDADPAGIVYYPNFFGWFALGTLELLRGWRTPFAELHRRE